MKLNFKKWFFIENQQTDEIDLSSMDSILNYVVSEMIKIAFEYFGNDNDKDKEEFHDVVDKLEIAKNKKNWQEVEEILNSISGIWVFSSKERQNFSNLKKNLQDVIDNKIDWRPTGIIPEDFYI